MDLQLAGKRAFISGSTAGIGYAIAAGLAREGARVIKRFSSPEEVASLVVWVASPLASSATGAALRVDGGTVKSAF